jgi:integrase
MTQRKLFFFKNPNLFFLQQNHFFLEYYQGNVRKTVVKPKSECITTHTARKTFVVNSIRLGIPLEIIMRWTGHKTLTAIKPYLEVVDEVKYKQMTKFNGLE